LHCACQKVGSLRHSYGWPSNFDGGGGGGGLSWLWCVLTHALLARCGCYVQVQQCLSAVFVSSVASVTDAQQVGMARNTAVVLICCTAVHV
jgi:hypothetical protein